MNTPLTKSPRFLVLLALIATTLASTAQAKTSEIQCYVPYCGGDNVTIWHDDQTGYWGTYFTDVQSGGAQLDHQPKRMVTYGNQGEKGFKVSYAFTREFGRSRNLKPFEKALAQTASVELVVRPNPDQSQPTRRHLAEFRYKIAGVTIGRDQGFCSDWK